MTVALALAALAILNLISVTTAAIAYLCWFAASWVIVVVSTMVGER